MIEASRSDKIESKTYNLYIGDFHSCKNEDVVLSTILGPCIAVCLSDDINQVFGMNHFLLPGEKTDKNPRFGYYLTDRLLKDMLEKGAVRKNLTARIYGAGDIIKAKSQSNASVRNANFIQKLLDELEIPIKEKDLGGNYGRKVKLFCGNGKVNLIKTKATIFNNN